MPTASENTTYFYCKGKDASAKGFISSEGFTVVYDSILSSKTSPSFKKDGKGYFNLREKLKNEEKIKDRKFISNYVFNSPSAAASVVLGNAANGNIAWKTEGGKKLKDA